MTRYIPRRLTMALSFAALFVIAQLPAQAQQTKPVAGAKGVTVTVKYSGKGTVDANHSIWVWLFNTPDINPGSIPIAEQTIEKNGGTATFANVSPPQVYIAIAYDEKGGFAGQAPPPSGSPIVFYGAKTAKDKPQPVKPGPKTSVRVTFNDAQRMQ